MNYKDCRAENVSVLIKILFIVHSNVINVISCFFYWFLIIICNNNKGSAVAKSSKGKTNLSSSGKLIY